jgi:hypothetical protein
LERWTPSASHFPGEARATVDATFPDASIHVAHARHRPIRPTHRARAPRQRGDPLSRQRNHDDPDTPRVRRYPRPSAHRVSDPSSRRAAAGCAARRRRATSKASATRRTSASLQSPRLTRTPTRTTSPRRCPTRSRTNLATPPTKTTRTTASSCRAPKSTRMPSNPPKARIGLTRLFFPCSAPSGFSVAALRALHVAHITACCNNTTSYVQVLVDSHAHAATVRHELTADTDEMFAPHQPDGRPSPSTPSPRQPLTSEDKPDTQR